MKKHVSAIVGLLVASAMLLSGCSGSPKSKQSSASSSGTKELTIGSYMNITTLVPWKTTSDGDGYILKQVYMTLVNMNQKMEYTPGLAKSWECSPDGKTWTFHLRDDVYWQTGNKLFGDEKVKVTANDVKFSYEYYLNKANGSVRYTDLSSFIQSINVVDDTTIQFVTKKVNVMFLNSAYQNYIIPEKGVESGWDFGSNPVGCGAYKFVKYDTDTDVVLEKNADYWKAPALDKITFKIITDKSVSDIALQNKEIDIAAAVLPTDVGSIKSKSYLNLASSGTGSYRWIGFNCAYPLFQDAEIRKALVMGVDFNSAINTIFKNEAGVKLAERAYGPIPEEIQGSDQEQWKKTVPAYDPKGAQKLLEQKGWAKGSDGIFAKDGQRFSFTLQVGNNDDNRSKLAVIVATQLKAIGVECTVKNVEWATQTADLAKGNVQMYIMGGYSGLDGGYRLMHTDKTTSSPNCNYSSDKVDSLLDQAWTTMDDKARAKLLAEASDAFVADFPHLGGYFEYSQIGYNKRGTDFGNATVYQPLCSSDRNVGVK